MRHRNDRFDKRLEVEFPVSVVGADGQRMSRASNLSAGGVQLQRGGIDGLDPGRDFELRLRLPEAPAPVSCVGTVVYRRATVVGLQFTQMPSGGRGLIDAFLEARIGERS